MPKNNDVIFPYLKLMPKLTDEQRVMVDKNLGLVYCITNRFEAPSTLPREDMEQAGCIGLMRAVQKFDPEREVTFSTYAARWIKATISYEIELSLSIQRPRHMFDKKRRVEKEKKKFMCSEDREPSSEELAELTGLSEAQIQNINDKLPRFCYSLNKSIGSHKRVPGDGSDAIMYQDLLVDERPLQDENISKKERDKIIDKSLRSLKKRTRGSGKVPINSREVVLRCVVMESQDLKDVGDMYGVTRQRVHQIKKKALEEMRAKIEAFGF